MSYLRRDLEGFDMMLLWAYLVIRTQTNKSSFLILEGGKA